MSATITDEVERVWACRLFSWTEEGEARGIETQWINLPLVIGRYVELKGTIRVEKLPMSVISNMEVRIDREQQFINWIGRGSPVADKEEWMGVYPGQRLSNFLEVEFAVKEADIFRDDLMYSIGNVGGGSDLRSSQLLVLAKDDTDRRRIFDDLTLQQRFERGIIFLRVKTDDSTGNVTGLELSTVWRVSGAGDPITRPEYFFDVGLQYKYEGEGQTLGELLESGPRPQEPTTYRLFGRSRKSDAGPIELECHLAFVYWNPIQNKNIALSDDIEIQVIDYDPVSANDTIGRGRISGGIAHIITVNKDENNPDVYFVVLTQGKFIELETNRLVTAGQRVSNKHYQPLPQKWSSKEHFATSHNFVRGFFDDFEGSSIGSDSNPLRFNLTLDCYFLPPVLSLEYERYIQPPTLGLVRPLLNGRSSGGVGPDIDLTEPLDEMENIVKSLGAGDFVYLSAWFFEPVTSLTTGSYHGASDWGNLFTEKTKEGVKIRIIINDFDPISGMDTWLRDDGLTPLNGIITGLSVAMRDNYKYIVSLHPAHVGFFKSLLAGQGGRSIYVASHHQKFMVVRRGDETFAFCGGLDIESRKVPDHWSYAGLLAWHDLHVMLEGPITRDLEKEFVNRWNREKGNSTKPPLSGWAPFETLTLSPLSATDNTTAKKRHNLQMLRTVSSDAATSPYDTQRDDIKQIYRRAIGCASRYLYFENQYFRSKDLAKWVVDRGRDQPDLIVIMLVVASAAEDDGVNVITEHGDYLQFETFDRIANGLGSHRVRLYSMMNRAVHSKFLMVDDYWMTIGSANANERSLVMDSELNVAILDTDVVTDFRKRLWAFNLGVTEATVASWSVSDFFTQWDAVATANMALVPSTADWNKMSGAGVIPFDHTRIRGNRNGSIPDALTNLELAPEGRLFAGTPPTGVISRQTA